MTQYQDSKDLISAANRMLATVETDKATRMVEDDDSSFFSSDDDYSDDSSCESDWSMEVEDFQNNLNVFPKSVSSPALIAMNIPFQPPLVNKEALMRQEMMRVDSAPALAAMPACLIQRMMKAELVIGDSATKFPMVKATSVPQVSPAAPAPEGDPNALFFSLLEARGIKASMRSALDLDGFFLPITDANIAGYDMQKVTAIRTEDIVALRQMLKEGQTMQVCNQFGESVLHSACRRGSTPVVQFLVREAHVSVRLADDYGRTPLHDACWTNKPNFDLIKILLAACPDLLLIADKRGFTPLQYVRKDLWSEWCPFLESHAHLILPRHLL
jgi:hypothetical protein